MVWEKKVVCCCGVLRYVLTSVYIYSDICMTYYVQVCARSKLKSKPFMLKWLGDIIATNSLMARALVYRTRDNGSISSW